MRIDYPPDGSMLLLLGLHLGDRTQIAGGELVLTINGKHLPINEETHVVVTSDVLESLEVKGWVNTDGDEPTVTDTGKYWLQRWCQSRLGKGKLVRIKR